MSDSKQTDLTRALGDYRDVVADVMAVANAWQEKLDTGELPSANLVANFRSNMANLNAKANDAWDRYCSISASCYPL